MSKKASRWGKQRMFLAAGEPPHGNIWRSVTLRSDKGAEGILEGWSSGNEASIEALAHRLEWCFPIFSECVYVCVVGGSSYKIQIAGLQAGPPHPHPHPVAQQMWPRPQPRERSGDSEKHRTQG